MKLNRYLQNTFGVIAAAFALISATASQAAIIQVSINTAALLSNPASASGPFYLDFQLNGGSALLGNTATISNFNFGGGSLTGTATTSGQVSGSLASTVTLTTDSLNSFNEFYQGFTPGSTLTFDVTHTTNVIVPTPDLFTVSILDSTLANITTDGLANSLVTLNIDSVLPGPQAFSGTGDFSGVVATAAPEPSRVLLLAVGIGAAALRRRRRA